MVNGDWASQAALAIWKDCLDRKGIKWECAKVPRPVLTYEIVPAWARIIRLAAIDQLQRMDKASDMDKRVLDVR